MEGGQKLTNASEDYVSQLRDNYLIHDGSARRRPNADEKDHRPA